MNETDKFFAPVIDERMTIKYDKAIESKQSKEMNRLMYNAKKEYLSKAKESYEKSKTFCFSC